MDFLKKLRGGLVSGNPDQTGQIGSQLAACLGEDSAIALSGDLGSGKTTFTRGLARGLGINAVVTSPTYNIYTTYNGRMQLLHMDAYRLKDRCELETLAIEDILRSPFVIAVEWPENISGFLDDYPTWWIRFDILQDHRHRIMLMD